MLISASQTPRKHPQPKDIQFAVTQDLKKKKTQNNWLSKQFAIHLIVDC